MVRPVLFACLVVALLSCSASGYSVSVDVRSDLVAGEDVTEIRTVLSDAVGTEFTHLEPIGAGDDLAGGVRAAEFDRLPTGEYVVEVVVRGTESSLSRRSLIVLRQDLSLTVVLSSACVGVTCPGTGDAPDATECDEGRCAPPECVGDCSAPPIPTCEEGPETCNGEDDDCDGAVDEGIEGVEDCNGEDDDCDGAVDEALTRSCSTACGTGAEMCAEGAWMACDAPPVVAETCNMADDDCDGVCDPNGIGCRHPIHRSLRANGRYFYTRNAAEITGHTEQTYNNYYLYTNEAPGLVPFYRCNLDPGHLYTRDIACEGAGTNTGVMGYIAPVGGCGSVPLYRLHMMGHYYTTDPAERDRLLASGWSGGGASGYVWLTP